MVPAAGTWIVERSDLAESVALRPRCFGASAPAMSAGETVAALAPIGMSQRQMARVAHVSRQLVAGILAHDEMASDAWYEARRRQGGFRPEGSPGLFGAHAAALLLYREAHWHDPRPDGERWHGLEIGRWWFRLRRAAGPSDVARWQKALVRAAERDFAIGTEGVDIALACPFPHIVETPTPQEQARDEQALQLLKTLCARDFGHRAGVAPERVAALRSGLRLSMPLVDAARIRSGRQPRRDGGVKCLVCGRWLPFLSTHLAREHGLREQAYRKVFGLTATEPLWEGPRPPDAVCGP